MKHIADAFVCPEPDGVTEYMLYLGDDQKVKGYVVAMPDAETDNIVYVALMAKGKTEAFVDEESAFDWIEEQ